MVSAIAPDIRAQALDPARYAGSVRGKYHRITKMMGMIATSSDVARSGDFHTDATIVTMIDVANTMIAEIP